MNVAVVNTGQGHLPNGHGVEQLLLGEPPVTLDQITPEEHQQHIPDLLLQ